MLALARSEANIPVNVDALNQHPMLLPCRNGTIDLATGELLPHDRNYLFTHGLDIDYDAQAVCPKWETFMLEIMGHPVAGITKDDDAAIQRARELSAYLQRLLGYCLTGRVDEQVIPIFFGGGANGKSVLIITMLEIMGALGKKATRELLMVKRNETHPTEITDLFGKRFVASTELERGQELAVALAKDSSGGEPLTARRMNENFWTFFLTHKTILSTNYRPKVKDPSHAMWRRIQAVPFTVTFYDLDDPTTCTPEMRDDPRVPKQNKNLIHELRGEFPGILAWLVRGCLAWQQIGIKPPSEVMLATQSYHMEEDIMQGNRIIIPLNLRR